MTVQRVFILLSVFVLVCDSSLQAAPPPIAVIAEDASSETEPGGLDLVESLAESGLAQSAQVRLISRRHLEKILAEQGLAYQNIVHDRSRLGRLAGADILLVVRIVKNRITQSRETVSAYGMTEHIVSTQSDAAITVQALEVESGRILAQRQFTRRNPSNHRALEDCAAVMETALTTLSFGPLARDEALPRHKVVVRPTAGDADIPGLDLFIDGNFIGNTPITTDVEEGVREVALRKGSRTLWSNRVQVLKEIWLTPDLGH